MKKTATKRKKNNPAASETGQKENVLFEKNRRIIRSFLELVTSDILRARLHQATTLRHQNLVEFLGLHKKYIVSSLQRCPRLLILVYPPENAKPYVHFWSFRLLCIVLRATKSLGVQEDDDVKYLLEVYERLFEEEEEESGTALKAQNKHGTRARQEWIGVCSAVQRLVENVGDAYLLRQVRNFICNAEIGSGNKPPDIDAKLTKPYQEQENLERNAQLKNLNDRKFSVRSKFDRKNEGVHFSKSLPIRNRPASSISRLPKKNNTKKSPNKAIVKGQHENPKHHNKPPRVDILTVWGNADEANGSETLIKPENKQQQTHENEISANLKECKDVIAESSAKERRESFMNTNKEKKATENRETAKATEESQSKAGISKIVIAKRRVLPLPNTGKVISDARSCARYTHSPYLQEFKPITRSSGLMSLLSTSKRTRTKTAENKSHHTRNNANMTSRGQRSASAGSLSTFMRRELRSSASGSRDKKPSSTQDINDSGLLKKYDTLEKSKEKIPGRNKRRMGRRRPASSSASRPKCKSSSRPQSATSKNSGGRLTKFGSCQLSRNNTSHMTSGVTRPESARIPKRNNSIASLVKLAHLKSRSASIPSYRKDATNFQRQIRSPRNHNVSAINTDTNHIDTNKITTAVSVYGNDNDKSKTNASQQPQTEKEHKNTSASPINGSVVKENKLQTSVTSDIKEHSKLQIGPKAADDHKPIYIEPDRRTEADILEDEECMKRIVNDVLVHQQVHGAARHPRLKDIQFVNRFFTYLRQNGITKSFLRSENCEPHKTWHLADGTKARFSFLQAFVFRHIDDTDTAAHYLVMKILHRIACQHKRRLPHKGQEPIETKDTVETKLNENEPKSNTNTNENKIDKARNSPRGRKGSRSRKEPRSRSHSQRKNASIGGIKGDRSTSLPRPDSKTPNMPLNNYNTDEMDCWKCRLKDLTMTICVNWRNRHICRLLKQDGVPYMEQHLSSAVKANDLDILQEIVNFLQANDCWFPGEDRVKSALYLARYHRLPKIVKFLEQKGVKDDRQVVPQACVFCRWF